MICCDTCEEWFHGKCVNVTKAQGKAMELKNMTWVCPPCKKNAIEKEKKAAAEARSNARRRSEGQVKPPAAAASSGGGGRLSKAAAAQQAEAAAAANAAKLAVTPDKISTPSTLSSKKLNVRRTDSNSEKAPGEGMRCA
jgi:hypothetical protein